MMWRLLIAGLCLYASLYTPVAHSLESLGWRGFVSGCGINWHWMAGSFEKAQDVQDACRQAGQSHAKRPGGRVLTVHGTKGRLIEYHNARCYFAPSEGLCGMLQASPECPMGANFVLEAEICFCGPASKEVNGKCMPGTDCDEMVKRLKQLKIPPTDVRYGFYRNQTCIAGKACAARTAMEDKNWLNKVVPDFVNPLIQKTGEWNKVIETCKRYGKVPVGSFLCQKNMADYHIENDLQKSLNKNGCGKEKDWKKVGDFITECVNAGVKNDLQNLPDWLQDEVNDFADKTVQTSRDGVYKTCQDIRKGK